jgi:hypothetical protein
MGCSNKKILISQKEAEKAKQKARKKAARDENFQEMM